MCTNNAMEYIKTDVYLFYANNKIVNQTSYYHTFQQNDIAEKKKHRYILDVVYTLMIHIPKIFVA